MIIITAFGVFVLGCLVAGVRCETDELLPPTVESLSWVTDFCYNMSWTAPDHHNHSCTYELTQYKDKGVILRTSVQGVLQVSRLATVEDGVLNLSLVATCGGRQSQAVHRSLVSPTLVRDLRCRLRTSNSTLCTWQPASSPDITDLRLYYLALEYFGPEVAPCPDVRAVAECPAYRRDDGAAVTGCVLPSTLLSDFYFVFNATAAGGTPVRNTFENIPGQLLPLIWTGKEDLGRSVVTVSWVPIGPVGEWKYILDYIKCGTRGSEEITNGTTSLDFPLGSCEVHISMMARAMKGSYHTESEPKRKYGRDSNPDPNTAILLASILIPVALASALLLALVCFRRHKDTIFPAVPKPADFLPDMMSSNKQGLRSMYEPAQEEEPEVVTLIVDPDP